MRNLIANSVLRACEHACSKSFEANIFSDWINFRALSMLVWENHYLFDGAPLDFWSCRLCSSF